MKSGVILLAVLVWVGAAALPAAGQPRATDVQATLEYNRTLQTSTWVNPDTGGHGAITPVRTFAGAAGQPCREFVTTIVVAGRDQQGYGTACRQPDGSWAIVADGGGTRPAVTTRVQTVPVPVVTRTRVVRSWPTRYDPFFHDRWVDRYGPWYGPARYPPVSLSFGWFHSDRNHRGHYRGYRVHREHHRHDGGHRLHRFHDDRHRDRFFEHREHRGHRGRDDGRRSHRR